MNQIIDKKVLIITDFNQNNANGINIKSYFAGWNLQSIAVADWDNTINEAYTPGINNYYCFGKKEIRYIWPLNLFLKICESQSYNLSKNIIPQISTVTVPEKPNSVSNRISQRIRAWQVKLMRKTGLSFIRKEIKLSNEFDVWMREYSPDIIYSSFGSIYEMEFLLKIKQVYGTKLVIHIFDDFVNSMYLYTIFPKYWKRRLNDAFCRLLMVSDLNLAVSEKMADEYNLRYKFEFHPLHYPRNINEWDIQIKSDEEQKYFLFLYTGKIDNDTAAPISNFIDAIETVNKNTDLKIEFQIWSQTSFEIWIQKVGKKVRKYLKGKAQHNQIPSLLKSADGLLLPLSYDPKSYIYTRLSISTKVPEYMFSGRPIFLLAPIEIAVSEYLYKYDCAYLVKTEHTLTDNIVEFVCNKEMRKRITSNAFERAKRYHTTEEFTKKLTSLISNLTW